MRLKKQLLLISLFLVAAVFQSFCQITEIGLASFYADKFDGRITASGEIFDQGKLTAAHRTLPFGTRVKVTNLVNKKSIEVVINDRGPFVNDRVIDLSKKGATELDFIKKGVVKVKVEVIKLSNGNNVNTASASAPVKKPKPQTKKPTPEKKYKAEAPKKNYTTAAAASQTPVAGSISSEALGYYKVNADVLEPKGYGIQIASYQEAANLMQRCTDLEQELQKDVIVQVAESHGKKVYRVIIGTFSTKESAERFKEGLSRQYNGSFVLAF